MYEYCKYLYEVNASDTWAGISGLNPVICVLATIFKILKLKSILRAGSPSRYDFTSNHQSSKNYGHARQILDML